MQYKLVLPTEVSIESVVDRMARAVWSVLAGDPMTIGLYQGYYVSVFDSIQGHLQAALISEQQLGGVRSLVLSSNEESSDMADGCGLEFDLTRAIVGRIHGVFDDARAVQLITRAIPEAIRGVLEPFLWNASEAFPAERASKALPHAAGIT